MFSSMTAVTSVLAVCTTIHLLMGLFTLAISITASVANEFMHYAVFRYSIPAEYAISLLSIASFSIGMYILRLKPRQRLIVDVFQVVNTVTASVVFLSIALKLNEIVSHVRRVNVLDEGDSDYVRFWVWWAFVFASAVMVGAAACLNIVVTKAYTKLNFMDSHTASDFLQKEVNILKCASVAQLAAGLTLLTISIFGALEEHFRWIDPRETELLWYSAFLELLTALLTIYSGVKSWLLSKNSTHTKRQLDVLAAVNIVICIIVALVLALATVTALIISIGFTYQVRLPQLWYYYTANGLAALVVAVAILALSVKTVKVSMDASGWITPPTMEEARI